MGLFVCVCVCGQFTLIDLLGMQSWCDSWVRYHSYLYHGLHNTRNVIVLVCSKKKRWPPALAYVYNPSFLKTPTLSRKSDNSNSSIVRRFPAQVQPWSWICPLLLHRCGLWWNKPQSSFLLEKRERERKNPRGSRAERAAGESDLAARRVKEWPVLFLTALPHPATEPC